MAMEGLKASVCPALGLEQSGHSLDLCAAGNGGGQGFSSFPRDCSHVFPLTGFCVDQQTRAGGTKMGRRGILKIISGNQDGSYFFGSGKHLVVASCLPEAESPWLLAYVPIRSCHRVLKDKYGEFSPPAFRADFPVSFWCNWTIWAGSRKHILIYIQGFMAKEACNRNEDKILFEGVSSLVESSVVYACWKKELHVFATFAQAVHVVLLKRYLPNQRDARFKGKYYVFQEQRGESSSKDDAVSGTSASKLPKKGGVFQSGWVGNLRDAPGFANTRGSTSTMQGRGIPLDTTAVGSPTELILCEPSRTQALATKAPCGLGSELLRAREAQGMGTPEGIIPTAAQDIWGHSPSVSEDSAGSLGPVHSVLLETPLLGAFQGAEPFWQPADVSLESSQTVLNPTLRPKGLGQLQLTIKPTGTGGLDWAVHSEPLSPGTGQSQEGTGATRDSQLSTASLDEDGSCAQLSVPADGLAKGLMPSLRSHNVEVTRNHLQLLPERSQSSLGHLSMPRPEPGTAGLQHTKLVDIFPLGSFRGPVRKRARLHPTAPELAVPALARGLEHPLTPVPALGTETIPVLVTSSTAPVPADFGSLDLIPEEPLPPQVEPVSMVASLPAALERDPVSLRQKDMSPARPGGREMGSPSPPCHPSVASELGTEGSSRCLGPRKQKLVLGQAGGQGGKPTASVGLMARSASSVFGTVPGPGVRLTQPEGSVSGGSGVTPASLSDTTEEHEVPVQHQDSAAGDKPASGSNLRGFKGQGTTEAVRVGAGQRISASFSTTPAHPDWPAAPWGETPTRDQKPWEPSGAPRNTQMAEGQQGKHAELGPPWVTEYFPIRSCHLIFRGGSGVFYLPLHADIKPNIWCNWTIWAGPQKHIVIYVQGFQGSDGCANNKDKIIFQGVSSSVETKVAFACHNRGTLIFAARATEVQVLFLSGRGSRSHEYRNFKGQYHVFRDPESVGSLSDTIAALPQETSKKESWRTVVTKGFLSVLTAPPGPPAASAGGRLQPDIVIPEEVAQHPPDLMEDGQSGANVSERGQDETRPDRNLKDSGSTGRETKDDVLVEPAPAGQDPGGKAEPPALEMTKGDTEARTALVTMVPCHPACSPCSETASSGAGVSDTSPTLGQASDSPSEVAAAAHHTQTPVLAEPPPNTSTKAPLHPSPGVAAADVESLGGRNEDLFGLMSSVENDTGLQSQHHPGDLLFEVTAEIKPKDWIPHGGSESLKSLLESLKTHVQKNLKLSANRVSEIKLKDVKRTSDASLLLTFWLHLEPEERNVSLLLRSQLQELHGASVGAEQLQLISLFVEDVNECQAGVGLCGEEADCFNGVGTYLCRCKRGYEDRSATRSGTLCIRAPRAGISTFLRHADMLVGAALVAGLVMLVAFGALCVTAVCGRSAGPEEPAVRAEEEPAMELHRLEECLQLDPFHLKLRARTPEWLWSVRAHPGRAGSAFPERPPRL